MACSNDVASLFGWNYGSDIGVPDHDVSVSGSDENNALRGSFA